MESSSLPACSRGRYVVDRCIRGLALAVGILVFSFPAFPQSSTGRILGSVHDKSDAAMAGAIVTISDVERGFSRSLVTDDAGEFVAPDLLPSAILSLAG